MKTKQTFDWKKINIKEPKDVGILAIIILAVGFVMMLLFKELLIVGFIALIWAVLAWNKKRKQDGNTTTK